MDRPLFAAPLCRATEDHGLRSLGMTGELDLDALTDSAPAIPIGEFRTEPFQLRFRRADDVAPAGVAQPGQIFRAGHAAVADPDATERAMPLLHGGHDRLQCARIVGIAGEHLIAQREAIKRYHERNAHLLAVGTVIAGIAALRLRIAVYLALKKRTRDVVEQNLVLDREQLAATLRQMRLQRSFMPEQMIKGAIQAILVDLRLSELQQVTQRGAAIPVLGDVQLAGWLAQPGGHQHGGDFRPANTLLSDRQQALA